MSAFAGRDLLLKIATNSGYVTCAGLRAKSVTLNSRPVDTTDQGSDGWRELLPGAGLRMAEITGSGVFRNASSDARLRLAFFEQSAIPLRFEMPRFGRLEGEFLVTRLRYVGTYDGMGGFEMGFVSSGALNFEPSS